jgi:hypothetical protein
MMLGKEIRHRISLSTSHIKYYEDKSKKTHGELNMAL